MKDPKKNNVQKSPFIKEYLENARSKLSKNPVRAKIRIGGFDNEAFTNEETNKMTEIEKQVYNLPVFKDLNNRFGNKVK